MNINKYVQNKYRVIQLVSFFMILVLTGCGSLQIGRDFDVKAFESMAEVGKTSKTQVRKVLGPPKTSGISINRDGERLVEWVYFFATGEMSKMDNARLKILQIRFDQNAIIRSYNWSNSDN